VLECILLYYVDLFFYNNISWEIGLVITKGMPNSIKEATRTRRTNGQRIFFSISLKTYVHGRVLRNS
jgi:hypothetical protein